MDVVAAVAVALEPRLPKRPPVCAGVALLPPPNRLLDWVKALLVGALVLSGVEKRLVEAGPFSVPASFLGPKLKPVLEAGPLGAAPAPNRDEP